MQNPLLVVELLPSWGVVGCVSHPFCHLSIYRIENSRVLLLAGPVDESHVREVDSLIVDEILVQVLGFSDVLRVPVDKVVMLLAT